MSSLFLNPGICKIDGLTLAPCGERSDWPYIGLFTQEAHGARAFFCLLVPPLLFGVSGPPFSSDFFLDCAGASLLFVSRDRTRSHGLHFSLHSRASFDPCLQSTAAIRRIVSSRALSRIYSRGPFCCVPKTTCLRAWPSTLSATVMPNIPHADSPECTARDTT